MYATVEDIPDGQDDPREALLAWLTYLRGAVVRNVEGLDERAARWRPEGALTSVLGIIDHLAGVEQRWIGGGYRGEPIVRDEAEFHPDTSRSVDRVLDGYRRQARVTEQVVRSTSLDAPCRRNGKDLLWVLLHLVNETARHAGHADATRELLDGATGE